MEKNIFLDSIVQPAFLVDHKAIENNICCFNRTFYDLFLEKNVKKEELSLLFLKPLVRKILKYLDETDAVVFRYNLPLPKGVEEVNVKCQYVDKSRTMSIVMFDLEKENTILPLEVSIVAQLFLSGLLIIEIRESSYYVQYANDVLYDMLGYTREECKEISSHDLFYFIYEEDRITGYESYKRQMEQGNQFYIDGRMKCKDGRLKWANFLGKQMKGIGERTFIYAVITDITDSLQLKEELSQEKQYFSALGHVSKNIVFRFNFEDQTVFCSGALLYKLTGCTTRKYTLEEILSGKTALFIEKEKLREVIATIKSGIQKKIILQVSKKNKERFWLSIEYGFIQRKDDTDASIAGEITDVTEQIEAREYYNKAITLWTAKQDDSEAALAINVDTGMIINGRSKIFPNLQLEGLDANVYFDTLSKQIINQSIKKELKTNFSSKNLQKVYKQGKIHFSYQVEIDLDSSLDWYQLTVSLLKNPKTEDLIALVKWNKINDIKFRERINHLLFYDTYDFICCIFAKTDGYMFIVNNEKNGILPTSMSQGYEKLVYKTIEQYAIPQDVEHLKFCFTCKNLIAQLSVNSSYSFVGHGTYPDGSPTVKFHRFAYLDKERQIILYTRKDITNKAELLYFKSENISCNVSFQEILYVESFGKKSLIITRSHKYTVNEMLSDIQKRLPGKEFVRCHRCYIVRYDAIQKIEKYTAILSNEERISISRKNIEMLRVRMRMENDR